MVPFINIPPLEIGPLTLHPFGFLVGIAILVGTSMMTKRVKRLGLNERVAADLALWAVIPGFIIAHLYSVIFYFPERIVEDPWVLLYLTDGISSFGGFLGGTGGVLFYLRRNKIPALPYADAMMWAFTFAWIFGRLGCTIAHDHPGLPSDFFLAVDYPAFPGKGMLAGPRHDLGFYELLWTIPMASFLWLTRNKTRPAGWHLALLLICYTPVRFLFDFLRIQDATYLGLTPGQYGAIALFLAGIWLMTRVRRGDEILVPNGEVHIFADGTRAIAAPAKATTVKKGPKKKTKKG